MATGYTASIEEGVTFKQFALDCAHAFGYLKDMRESPMSSTIPDKFHPSPHHKKELERAEKALYVVRGLTLDIAETRALYEWRAAVVEWEDSCHRMRDLKAKYEAMLAQVQAWVPPTHEHQCLKDFMVQQITQSIEHDCYDRKPYRPKLQTPQEWLQARVESAQDGVAYHTAELAKEIESCRVCTAWVRALKTSLK